MQFPHSGPKLCCIAKRHVLPDIAITVVRNGLRILLPALSSFQPCPSEMFGGNAGCFKLQRPAPSGRWPFFHAWLCSPAREQARKFGELVDEGLQDGAGRFIGDIAGL